MNHVNEFQLPKGFQVSGVSCGIKADATKKDLTLICMDNDGVAAGVFTENVVRSPSIFWNESQTPTSNFRALVVNSGNANACTGTRGADDVQRTAKMVAEQIGCDAKQILVLSTGIIGHFLPMEKIASGIANAVGQLGTTPESIQSAAEGILTTDTFSKVSQKVDKQTGSTILGFAKGAGMIGPRMSTMLGMVMTDASLTPEDAKSALKKAVDKSFNCISVEGHMSTSDSVLLMANSANSSQPLSGDSLEAFTHTLTEMCMELAQQIPDDGEGASHLIEINIKGTSNDADAAQIAKSIANSALVKTAIAGNDPNWGRIVSAAGYAGVPFDVSKTSLKLNRTQLYEAGVPVEFNEKQVSESIQNSRRTLIDLVVGDGPGEMKFWTSDLTVEYVKFNSEYST